MKYKQTYNELKHEKVEQGDNGAVGCKKMNPYLKKLWLFLNRMIQTYEHIMQ